MPSASPSPTVYRAPSLVIGVWTVVFAFAFGLSVASLGSWQAGAALVGAFLWFASPGVLFAWRAYRHRAGAGLAAALLGPAWGFALSTVVLLALWVAGWRGGWLVVAAPVGAAGVTALAGRVAGRLRLPALGRRDVAAVLAVLLLVPAICGWPYSRVGVRVPDGKAYRAYFTADFVWAMAVVAEVSKGDVPPRNPFLKGESLHYYWLAHLLSAVEHRFAGRDVPVEQILLTNALLLDLAFVSFLYVFVRHAVRRPAVAAMSCAFVVLFSSFEGTQQLLALWRLDAPFALVTDLNIDAITRWIFGSLPVDGLHRLLLYAPHHALAWTLALSALLVVMQAEDPVSPAVNALAGTLLACALLVSSFLTIMVGVCVAGHQVVAVISRRAWRAALLAAGCGAVPVALAMAVAHGLQYVDPAGALVTVGQLNPGAVHNAPVAIFLSFGPVLWLAPIGAWFALRSREPRLAGLMIPVAVAAFSYFFVDVPEHQHVYVGWRAGHLMFIVSAALVGIAFESLWGTSRRVQVVGTAAIALLALAAAPMTAIDLYNTQDVSNRGQAAGFPWTLVLTFDELEALAWIREYTRPSDLVQVEPTVRDPGTWAYLPAFAERRMSAGIPISMIPLGKYQRESERIREMYAQTSSEVVHRMAQDAQIDYLLVGAPEREAYPELERLLAEAPQWFSPAFRNGSMSIFAVD